jgi:hypothetical protein|tara:strand:+ start:304 stop:672 length:369 start_codon:yes stop_codon:yes gene_type:complete
MNPLELAWDTFDFHGEDIARLEALQASNMMKVKVFSSKRVNPTESEKHKLLNNILSCCGKLISNYQKQLHSISELNILYDSGVEIPLERQMDNRYLDELADLTMMLIHEVKAYRERIVKKLS